MTKAYETILNQIAALLADMDKEIAAKNRIWGREARDAIKAKRDELKDKRREMGEFAYYARVFAAAGGKSWFTALDGRSDDAVANIMDRNSELTAKKRNATIAAKLAKVGIKSLITSGTVRTNDGFDGRYTVMTDNGEKTITINTIFAGGYNIQCFHARVLVKVK